MIDLKSDLSAPHVSPLAFPSVLVIVGGGAVDLALLARLHEAGAAVIAADGGAHTCRRAGIMPQAIIGDMDSLDSDKGWPAATRIIKLDEQDTTDFEKCLYMTKAPVTLALGMTGDRLDHTLASLDALARHAATRRIILIDTADLALGVCGSFDFDLAAGARISVHPLSEVRFAHSSGLLYPLDGLHLVPGKRTSTSNTTTAAHVHLEVAAGDRGAYLVIVGLDHLDAIITRELAQTQSGEP